jgi:signal transduction histidine kinase
MTATARLVATPGSGRRMALDGPSDELHDLADTIDAMLDRLDTAFDAQRRFVADASHELRTPLAVLTTEVDVALDDPDASTSALRASLGRVHHELRGTSRLVESLLHLSRAEIQSNTAPYDLATSAEQAIAVVQRLGVGHVRMESSLTTAPVLGDPLLLDRLTSNLVENAFRHNVEGGLVHVATSSLAGVSMLVVENDGPLIDEAIAQGLFERFRRGAHGSVQRSRTDGHGLGLSIVKTIVATHGGTIELHARGTGGLRIEVRLPTA